MYLARHHRRGSRGMGTHQGFPEYHSLLEVMTVTSAILGCRGCCTCVLKADSEVLGLEAASFEFEYGGCRLLPGEKDKHSLTVPWQTQN